MSWPDGALLALSAIPCSLSPLISRVHSFLFSDWRRTVSSKFFDTQVPLISTEELVLPRHACCVLIRLRCNKHSLQLSSYLSMIGQNRDSLLQLLPFFCGHSHQDTSYLNLQCPAANSLRAYSLASICLSTTSGPGPGELLCLWGSMVFHHAPISLKGSGNKNNKCTVPLVLPTSCSIGCKVFYVLVKQDKFFMIKEGK